MTNFSKTFLLLGVLVSAACGGDDSGNTAVDAGGVIVRPADSGTPVVMPDAGNVVIMPTNDGGVPTDSGVVTPGDCFSGTPVKMEDFLNRCTGAQVTTKMLAVPAALQTPNGGVVPL